MAHVYLGRIGGGEQFRHGRPLNGELARFILGGGRGELYGEYTEIMRRLLEQEYYRKLGEPKIRQIARST